MQEDIESLKWRQFNSLTEQELWKLKKLGIINGCGGKGVIIRPPQYIFFEASCDKHDHGYWRGKDRLGCDIKFLQAMIRDCNRALDNRLIKPCQYTGYLLWSITYYLSVRAFGWIYFAKE